jgi:hypothetical protein
MPRPKPTAGSIHRSNGAEPYKQRVQELFPTMLQRIRQNGWSAVRTLPYLDASYKAQLREAVKTYIAQLDKDMAATPFGVPPAAAVGVDRAALSTSAPACTSFTRPSRTS